MLVLQPCVPQVVALQSPWSSKYPVHGRYPSEGGVPDGGVPEGGVPEGGVPEGGVPEGGVPEGGVPEGGVPEGDGDGHSEPKSGHATPEKYTPRTTPMMVRNIQTTITTIMIGFINNLRQVFFKEFAHSKGMLITASVAAAPPAKPRRLAKTIPKPKNFFTLHTQANDAFTLKLSPETKTSIVGFQDWDDALFIGKMIETHFIREKEWPDTKEPGKLSLPSSTVGEVLRHVYIQQWDFDELKLTCTKNFLDLIGVEGLIQKKNNGYTFDGSVYRFQADWDFYRTRLSELWIINEPDE